VVSDADSTTPAERALMIHALGIDPRSRRSPKHSGKPRSVDEHRDDAHRNFFATAPADPAWEALVDRGLAVRGRLINDQSNELRYYHVSEAGKAALR
jgi:hypothetical protein